MHDVIVVGVGAMGAATCWQLARRGARVLGLEQYDVPHALGSSGGESRLIRLAYYEHPDYVPLLRRAYALWRELERESSSTLLHVTGGLYLGRPDEPFIAESRRAAELHGIEHELLTPREIAVRFPAFAVADDHVALFEPAAGVLLAEPSVAAFAAAALRSGAAIHTRERALDWSADAAGVTVRTDRAIHRAAHLAVTAGPWTGALARDLGVPLVVTRQVMGWVAPRRPERFALGAIPVWARQEDDGSLLYGMPILPGGAGLKIARHRRGPEADPDELDRTPRSEDEADFQAALRGILPQADGELRAIRVCLYTNSPDGHFVVDRNPRHERVTIACGFSGHGFKFAPVIGEALAELATRGRTALPIGFLSLARFAAS